MWAKPYTEQFTVLAYSFNHGTLICQLNFPALVFFGSSHLSLWRILLPLSFKDPQPIGNIAALVFIHICSFGQFKQLIEMALSHTDVVYPAELWRNTCFWKEERPLLLGFISFHCTFGSFFSTMFLWIF